MKRKTLSTHPVFGEIIREYRKLNGASLGEFAEMLGISARSLSDVELNRRCLSSNEANRLLTLVRKLRTPRAYDWRPA